VGKHRHLRTIRSNNLATTKKEGKTYANISAIDIWFWAKQKKPRKKKEEREGENISAGGRSRVSHMARPPSSNDFDMIECVTEWNTLSTHNRSVAHVTCVYSARLLAYRSRARNWFMMYVM